ncbi:hypothetical protein MTR67_032870 [Solanum verrucosum]|uniref:xyloglucan:xyloglucosyl transferase n=1 Tax=Solanum verrucosum TaxID=315347 RepID=A0AAF0ZIG6_SOLVR|nr:hypothetical protein MTR67_032870 [Solanum verrucosum]
MANSHLLLISIVLMGSLVAVLAAGNFNDLTEITWGDGRGKILDGGKGLSLSLDKLSGSGFQSKNEYLYGRFDMQIKFVPKNSAGTVTTFFLSSQGEGHDEIDFEFLGNVTGEPYTVHTNVYSQGKGNKEQQFHLWFDPTTAFHTYTIVWNANRIVFLVDEIPIRVYNNHESIGIAYPKSQPMKVYCSLWNADEWATQGGRVKTNWTQAPFTATYRNINIDGCVVKSGASSCASRSTDSANNAKPWETHELDAKGRNRVRWLSVLALVLLSPVWADNFYQDATVTFGDQRAQIQDGGRLLALSLDKISGSGFQSKNEYLFGRFDMQLKLVPGNSAGTVTTFYARHDEIDFEFLGNSSGQPYTVHTNVYSQGKGNKEQQFRLWFDPTSSFHTYSIVWNSQRIIFLVDNIPIRVFNNHEALGVAFPKNQAMRVYASLWNADDWATQGGRVKTDWSMAPFTASYRNFNTNACVWSAATSTSSCGGSKTESVNNDQTWQTQQLNANGRNRLRWVQQKYMIYNYCADANRFSQGFSPECKRSRF